MRWPLIRFLRSHRRIDFVRLAPFAAVLSGLAIIASCVSFGVLHLNLGIDFAGGTEIEIVTPGPAPLSDLRGALNKMGESDPQVVLFGSANSAMVRFKPPKGQDPDAVVVQVKANLAKQFP